MQNTSVKRAIFCAMLVLGLNAHAQDATQKQQPAKKGADQKVDISDLENKYWAPKDTDFSVVQNRTYTKAGHWFLTPQIGLLVNDSYSKGTAYGIAANYFFNERHGVQLSYQRFALSDNSSTTSFRDIASGVYPDHNKPDSFIGVGYSFVPFYAKMSFLGTKVMYFDMAITPVIGATKYVQTLSTGDQSQTAFSYGVDITQYFFINRWFAVRLDLDNHWTNETKLAYANSGVFNPHNVGDNLGSYSNLDTTFTLGFTFYF